MSFLAVSLESDVTLVKKGAAQMGIAMPVASTEMQVLDPFGVKTAPSTVWVNEDGKIIAAASGGRSFKFFEARTKELLP